MKDDKLLYWGVVFLWGCLLLSTISQDRQIFELINKLQTVTDDLSIHRHRYHDGMPVYYDINNREAWK